MTSDCSALSPRHQEINSGLPYLQSSTEVGLRVMSPRLDLSFSQLDCIKNTTLGGIAKYNTIHGREEYRSKSEYRWIGRLPTLLPYVVDMRQISVQYRVVADLVGRADDGWR